MVNLTLIVGVGRLRRIKKYITSGSILFLWDTETLIVISIPWLMLLTVVLEKTLESPLDCKEIQPVHPKSSLEWLMLKLKLQYWCETPPDAKSWLIWKDPDAGKDWGQGMTEDEMVGWHYRLNGHEFGWTPGVGDGQGGLVCCDSWGRSQTWLSDWTELNWILIPVWNSSSPAFHVMYSAYKFNKQGDNIQPYHTSFLILN